MDADAVTRLRRVVGKLARELNASATGEGLTPTQASVLGLIVGRGPLSLSELIEFERINPTMLSRVLGKLDDAGLIRRLPHPEDQRAVRVEATRRGRSVQERIRARRTAIVAERAAKLPPEHAQTIIDALPALEALAQQFEDRHPRPTR
jgi:DNA-binding MarR family transcriptional regulator